MSSVKRVYEFDDYKHFIRALPAIHQVTFSWIADKAQIHKQYLSRVLSDSAHLSEEQIYDMATALNFDASETEYFLLLLREAKASRVEYRNKIKKQRQNLRQTVLGVENQVTSSTHLVEETIIQREYYSDTRIQLLHVLLLLPPSRRPEPLLCRWLGLSEIELNCDLQKLTKWQLCEKRGTNYFAKQSERHLAKDVVLIDQNHRNWRSWASQRLANPAGNDFRYSATISADEDTRLWFIAQLKELLAKAHRRIPSAKDDQVFVVGMDVLSVTKTAVEL